MGPLRPRKTIVKTELSRKGCSHLSRKPMCLKSPLRVTLSRRDPSPEVRLTFSATFLYSHIFPLSWDPICDSTTKAFGHLDLTTVFHVSFPTSGPAILTSHAGLCWLILPHWLKQAVMSVAFNNPTFWQSPPSWLLWLDFYAVDNNMQIYLPTPVSFTLLLRSV